MRHLLSAIVVLLFASWSFGQQGPNEIAIDLASFGVGGAARPSEWAGIRLNITDRGAQPREVMIRLHLTDVDGDHPTYTRVIVTNPPLTQGVWLYAHLPRAANTTYEVTANAAVANDDGSYRPGRLLGSATIAPAGQIRPAWTGFYAVLGSRHMQLYQYAERFQGQEHPPASHERTFSMKDLTPADLPDRDLGLAIFDAVIWAEGDPIELSSERVEAMRRWVRGGGHLVVVLPRVGQTWLTNRNPLIDILPRVSVARRDGVDLEPYRPLLCDRPPTIVSMPTNATVHVFEPREDAGSYEAMPILAGPDGEAVVVRRLVGCGAVTLVGLDVNSPILEGTEALDPDIFWHRALGRRGDLLKAREMTLLQQQPGVGFTFPNRSFVAFDGAFGAEISKTGTAAAGVLLGFIVFVLFWVVAGPGGFAVLKGMHKTKHAWVGYAAVTGIFTIIAWGGATLIKPKRVDATYLRFVDHVYDQNVQRARLWSSVLIPWYGDAEISIGTSDSPIASSRIVPWRPPSGDSPDGGFPDARSYEMLASGTSSMTPPTRATVKNIMADWIDEPAWKMPIPAAPAGMTEGTLWLLSDEERDNIAVREQYTKPDAAGMLTHDLPAALENVLIIVVHGQTELRPPRTSMTRLTGGPLLADARAYSRTGAWAPGEPLDLMDATSVPVMQNGRPVDLSARDYLERLLPSTSSMAGTPSPSDTNLTQRLTALALYPMLEPPDPDTRMNSARHIVAREQTHGWDLGRWFTQPCIIIIGHIPDLRDPEQTPAPIFVDGRRAPMRGRTVVRWVYPLEPNPPAYPETIEEPEG